ncbi:hypothetical protein Hamer_G029121, partial [Homarus americanus]
MAYQSAAHESTGYTLAKLMLGHELRLPVDLLTESPPDEELPEGTSSYVKSLQERLTEVHHQVRGALEFPGEKGQSPKLQSSWEGPYTVVERLSDVTYWIRVRRKAQPKVVHVNRLWQYHEPGQYTREDSVEQPPTTDEDQTGDPGRTPGSPTMDQEEEHCSLLAELDVTREGDRYEDVTKVAAPREDSEDIPVRRLQQR